MATATTLTSLLEPFFSISLIGMSKNAGKTTVLNSLIRTYESLEVPLGLTSIGLDGEDIDQVTGSTKPRIFVPTGTLIATASGLLEKSDLTKEIVKTTGIPTSLGEVVVARARNGGYVLLGGSPINSHIAELCQAFAELGAAKVFVDGAFQRRAVANPLVTEATVLCSGAALHVDMARVVQETAYVATQLNLKPLADAALSKAMSQLPEGFGRVVAFSSAESFQPLDLANPGLTAAPAHLYLRGALTDSVAAAVSDYLRQIAGDKPSCTLVVDDASKLLLGDSSWQRLMRTALRIQVLRGTNLVAVAVNPTSPMGYCFPHDEFRREMQRQVGVPVLNVVEGGLAEC